ncbi:NAD(P)-binding protein [Aspergillus carlsbadensis]|nr:NAD(P)-binding protein [Aspergillus carlsbadensis]
MTEFNSLTLAADVAAAFPESIKGKTILITGVSPNSLGLATAAALAAQAPERLILTERSADKVQAAVGELKSRYPDAKYEVLLMDLSSQESVRSAAATLNSNAEIPSIDILINNAGVMDIPERTLSKDGSEISFATNHIRHFLFTKLITEKLIAASKSSQGPVRIINLTSFGHQFSPIRFSDINFTKKAADLAEEERPELQKAQFFYGRDWSDDAEKHGITSYAAHPGVVDTNIGRHSNPAEVEHAQARAKELGFSGGPKTREQGANSSVWAAVNPHLAPVDFKENLVKGVYVTDCAVADEGCADFARNAVYAERLWKLSEELVGERFFFFTPLRHPTMLAPRVAILGVGGIDLAIARRLGAGRRLLLADISPTSLEHATNSLTAIKTRLRED